MLTVAMQARVGYLFYWKRPQSNENSSRLYLQKKPIFSLFSFSADAYESYTMMAKPIRALELHYPMIQFLIILFTPLVTVVGKFVHLKTACIWAVQLILAL